MEEEKCFCGGKPWQRYARMMRDCKLGFRSEKGESVRNRLKIKLALILLAMKGGRGKSDRLSSFCSHISQQEIRVSLDLGVTSSKGGHYISIQKCIEPCLWL